MNIPKTLNPTPLHFARSWRGWGVDTWLAGISLGIQNPNPHAHPKTLHSYLLKNPSKIKDTNPRLALIQINMLILWGGSSASRSKPSKPLHPTPGCSLKAL